MIPKKLPPIPKALFNTAYTATLFEKGIDEDGKKIVHSNISGKCIFSEKRKQIMNTEKQIIQLEGSVIVNGDIAPKLVEFANGTINIKNGNYKINRVMRPTNPDGTVHHTTLELI